MFGLYLQSPFTPHTATCLHCAAKRGLGWQKSGGLKHEDAQAVGFTGVYDLTAAEIAQNFMQVAADRCGW